MYGTFLDKALVDDESKPTLVSTNAEKEELTLTLPHFWIYATIDPGMAMGENVHCC